MPWCESMRRCAWLTSAWCWASLSHAAQPLDLTWQAPPGCPQEAAVREQIRALVPSAMLERGLLKAEGTITRIDSRFRLNLALRLGDIRGERSIDSDSCSDLAGAAAVAVGLLLQSATQPEGKPSAARDDGSSATGSGTATDSAKTKVVTESPAKPSTPAAPADATPKTEPDRARSWRAFLQAPELAVNLGPLPKPSIGLAAAAGLSVEHWLFAASFQLPRGQEVTLRGPSGAGANLEHLSLSLWACRSWRASRFELGPCLTISLERLTATGTGAGVSPESRKAIWVSLGTAALGRLQLVDWLAITASAGAELEGARPTVRIDGLDDYRRLAPVALAFRTGVMWIF
jgi:hypothetical protein